MLDGFSGGDLLKRLLSDHLGMFFQLIILMYQVLVVVEHFLVTLLKLFLFVEEAFVLLLNYIVGAVGWWL